MFVFQLFLLRKILVVVFVLKVIKGERVTLFTPFCIVVVYKIKEEIRSPRPAIITLDKAKNILRYIQLLNESFLVVSPK